MIRCRCGVYSNYGLSCSSCRVPYSIIPKTADDQSDEEETEEIELESLEELEELSDLEEEDD